MFGTTEPIWKILEKIMEETVFVTYLNQIKQNQKYLT